MMYYFHNFNIVYGFMTIFHYNFFVKIGLKFVILTPYAFPTVAPLQLFSNKPVPYTNYCLINFIIMIFYI